MLPQTETQFSSSTPIAQSTIKIASFNLLNYLAPPDAYYDFENIYSLEQWQKKQRWIVATLNAQQPDIIGFQEVFSIDNLKALLLEAGYPYFETIDTPIVEGDFIYRSPGVTGIEIPDLRSRAVEAESEAAQLMGWNKFDLAANHCVPRLIFHILVRQIAMSLTLNQSAHCLMIHYQKQ